eukprot:GAHX01000713.1.p2 GENE.GAHX01000713.1~~GAHX01000713.1.p2  ORF type:complete len:198 (-),score=52.13 GAHX01000713.1:181-774(-)
MKFFKIAVVYILLLHVLTSSNKKVVEVKEEHESVVEKVGDNESTAGSDISDEDGAKEEKGESSVQKKPGLLKRWFGSKNKNQKLKAGSKNDLSSNKDDDEGDDSSIKDSETPDVSDIEDLEAIKRVEEIVEEIIEDQEGHNITTEEQSVLNPKPAAKEETYWQRNKVWLTTSIVLAVLCLIALVTIIILVLNGKTKK